MIRSTMQKVPLSLNQILERAGKLYPQSQIVSRLPDSAGDAAVAQTIIALAHSLRIKVVAEGVETEQQLEFLRARQCDMGQGFRFGKGGTVDDICAQNFEYGDDAPWLSQIGTAVDVGLQRLRAANS